MGYIFAVGGCLVKPRLRKKSPDPHAQTGLRIIMVTAAVTLVVMVAVVTMSVTITNHNCDRNSEPKSKHGYSDGPEKPFPTLVLCDLNLTLIRWL